MRPFGLLLLTLSVTFAPHTSGSLIPPFASSPSQVGLAAPRPLPSPAQGRASLPQLTTHPDGVVLSWVETDGARATLRFSERSADGWTAARTVASGSDWFVNWADVPSVVRLDRRRLAAHWLQKSGPDTYAYDVRLAFSSDDGRTWSPSTTPHHDGTKTEHGFASLLAMPGGDLNLVWLDGRAMTPGEHGHGGGAMSLRAARFDRAGRQTGESLVDNRVCECCPTALALTADGPIAAFRNRAEGEIRDIHVSRFTAGAWTTSVPVFDDRWEFPACPVNGPAIDADGRRVAVSWFTMRDGVGRAFAAFSTDAGRSFGAPVRLDDEAALGRVDVALLVEGAVATWIEFAQDRAEWRMRAVSSSGARGPARTIARVSASRSSGYPRLARRGRELVLAWTQVDGGTTTIATASVAVP
jgi:hypothetical protein